MINKIKKIPINMTECQQESFLVGFLMASKEHANGALLPAPEEMDRWVEMGFNFFWDVEGFSEVS
jgi:hypothetical protein